MSEERKLITCPKCGNNLGVVKNNTVEVVKYNKGQKISTTLGFEYKTDGRMTVNCGSCGPVFARGHLTRSMTYVVKVDKDAVDKTDKKELQ